MGRTQGHRWQFFRAGGVDQVSLRDASDLGRLAELDQKLWVALAMPTTGVDVEAETLALLDHDKDSRIRVQDILDAIHWAKETLVDIGSLLTSSDEVNLAAIADPKVLAAARRMLSDLGKPDAAAISVADASAITDAFTTTVLNGDGVVIPESASEPDARLVIEEVIACVGSVVDRSGKPGVDAAKAELFFADVDRRAAWLARGKDPALNPLGPATAAAAGALAAVRSKIEDYFVRCQVAAYDPRGADALAGQEAALVGLAQRALTGTDPELEKLPLARIAPAARLPLGTAINPAWAARMASFVSAAIDPIVGRRDVLTPSDLALVVDKLAAFDAWNAERPVTLVDALEPARIEALAAPEPRTALAALIAADAALTDEYNQITAVAKLVRMQRDFGRILRNFVNFSDFYSRQDGLFQNGTLYIDGRALRLCVPVSDAGKHAALAPSSDACLLYCDLKRQGQTQQIAAALTNGDSDNVFPGRNGIFYDREGKDWDATVTRVVSNPISVRQAFWSPYRKLFKAIEETVQKRAQAAEASSAGKLEATGARIGNVDKLEIAAAAAAAAPPPPADKPPETKKLDLGAVAAIGVAIGGIGTLVGVLMSNLLGLGGWLPIGLIALLLMISGPSMLLAWLKLRRRNLGPVLDANGWAINGRARVNVAFGAAMTQLARLPDGARRALDDPFADKRRPWKLYLAGVTVLALAGFWYLGKLDHYLPSAARSVSVLGEQAPGYRAPAGSPPAPAPIAASPAPAGATPQPATPSTAATSTTTPQPPPAKL
jgi:hypothetical protein